jgi:hypothetical protein
LQELGDGPNGVKGADFLKINPCVLISVHQHNNPMCSTCLNMFFLFRNGRVPAIVDHTNNDKIVWESGAILLYIAERFDPTGKLIGKSLEERAEVWEWLFFQARPPHSVQLSLNANCRTGLWPRPQPRPGRLVPPKRRQGLTPVRSREVSE